MLYKGEGHKLDKLRVGFTFDHGDALWKITEVGEYSWLSSGRVVQYTVKSKDGAEAFVEHEIYKEKDLMSFSKKEELSAEAIETAIQEEYIEFDGKEYDLDETLRGSFENLTTASFRNDLTCYYFMNGDDFVSIDKWSDGNFEVFVGYEFDKDRISNIRTNVY
jgi:hypothetical protein